jgi:hypothetical protein
MRKAPLWGLLHVDEYEPGFEPARFECGAIGGQFIQARFQLVQRQVQCAVEVAEFALEFLRAAGVDPQRRVAAG